MQAIKEFFKKVSPKIADGLTVVVPQLFTHTLDLITHFI
jgi:hypothetical protein